MRALEEPSGSAPVRASERVLAAQKIIGKSRLAGAIRYEKSR
jgi:hypothetical protein